MPPATVYDPPPYSLARVRTLAGAGVSSVVSPSGSRRTRTRRPPSAGRLSTQYRSSPSSHGSLSRIACSTTSSTTIGERHEPYGATVRSVVTRSGSVLPRGDVRGLLRRHRLELDPERGQLEPGDLGVDRLGHHVDLRFELGVVGGHVLGRQGLVGEAHIHHRSRVALGRTKVHEAALGDEVELLAAEIELQD